MKLNTEKYLEISGDKHEKIANDIEEDKIWGTSNVELLGIAIDNQLKFARHVSNLCSKANSKISVFTWIIKQTLKKEEHYLRHFSNLSSSTVH